MRQSAAPPVLHFHPNLPPFSPFFLLNCAQMHTCIFAIFTNTLAISSIERASERTAVSPFAPSPPSIERRVNERARTPSRRYRPAAAFRLATQTKSKDRHSHQQTTLSLSKLLLKTCQHQMQTFWHNKQRFITGFFFFQSPLAFPILKILL